MRRHSRSNGTEKVPEADLENNVQTENNGHDVPKIGKLGLIKNCFIDYSANSNLHGLKYIGEREISLAEKIFWFLMFICSMALCGYLIQNVWRKRNESPVIVSFAEKLTPIWQIPHPAVTVCFETKAKQTQFNYTKYYHLYKENNAANLTENEKRLFEDVSLACNRFLNMNTRSSLENQTVKNIKLLAPHISEFSEVCMWRKKFYHCANLFYPILTEDGVCYTFNAMSAEKLFRLENLHTEHQYLEFRKLTKWTIEGGYPPTTPLETYPHRASGYGVKTSLHMVLSAKKMDLDYLCKGSAQGFKILLHNPAEMPRLSQKYFRVPLAQEVVVAVKPNMMTATEGLRPYNANVRQCYFHGERELHYFRVYTQSNCELECLTNFTYIMCGCVHFGMPRGPNMTVCNAGSIMCTEMAEMELVTIEIQSGLEEQTSDELGQARDVAAQCNCLPSCTSIEYEADTSQSDVDYEASSKAFQLPVDPKKEYSRVIIYFKEAQFITSRRSELYGLTEFLANCGGLLGLFMGFSVLSLAEIIYFFTLRLYCSVRRQRRIKVSMNNEALKSKAEHYVY